MSKKLTQEEFIGRSVAVHGDRYDYSKSVYAATQSSLIITCRKHGDFLQSPNRHFGGSGCPSCRYEKLSVAKTIPALEFNALAKEKHGDKFKYDLESYSSMGASVRIECKTHGWFSMTAVSHLKSILGCKVCGHKTRGDGNSYDTDEFIRRARNTHGDRYDYSKTEYSLSKTPVTITCRDHGDFQQMPNNHLFTSGCPSCAKTGFSPSIQSVLYVLKSECGSMLKVGITRNLTQRLSQLRRATPFSFNLEHKESNYGDVIFRLEKHWHGKLMSCELKGFHGASEWFRYDSEILEAIKKGA